MKGECDVLKERDKARGKECEELKAKCEAAMADFDIIPPLMFFVSYQENLTTLESKFTTLEVEKGRAEVVSKVVPYVAMKLVHSDEMAMLVGKLVSSAGFYRRCVVFKEAADMKQPFDLEKVKGYRPSYKKEHTKAGNDLATATFPFLSKVITDPSASVEALLTKKPKSIRHPTPTKTHAPVPSAPSQKATPSSAYVLKYVSLPFII
ncbi:hypothetical protein Tco_0836005 [Tanacetum coccineum]